MSAAEPTSLVIGTAGHIDHGKTALVEALTGVDCDRLEEEKRRGITIELGFAPWRLSPSLHASIVDVPGHERLVRTMVAGASGIDVALLVVAADDGVMPQTREHLGVLSLLGVRAGVVALSKCDKLAADPELLDLAEQDVRAALAGTPLATAPIVRTSARSKEGLEELRRVVADAAGRATPRPTAGPAVLPLDRLFSVSGRGTVGTGTLLRGTLAIGDELEAFGDGLPLTDLRVRGLQSLAVELERAEAGRRTAVHLGGAALESLGRGMTLASAGAFVATQTLVVWVRVLPGCKALGEETLTVHLGTTDREAEVVPLGATQLAPGDEGAVLLRLARPVLAFAGQPLVLRRPGAHGQATVAGGPVLDPEPSEGKGMVRRAAAAVPTLRLGGAAALESLAGEARAAGVLDAALERRLPPGAGAGAAAELARAGTLVAVGEGRERRWVQSVVLEQLAARLGTWLEGYHQEHPTAAGLPEAEVATRLSAPERHLATAVIEVGIAAGTWSRKGAVLVRASRPAAVDAATASQLEQLRAAVRAGGAIPPFSAELAPQLRLQPARLAALLDLARRRGELVRVKDDLHYDPEVLRGIEARVRDALAAGRGLTASELKPALGQPSRKWAIPLLEHFDRAKLTLRRGEVRTLHPSAVR